ncbi:shikimate [Myriangium duriaei CBS 260.36]|uniref:Shikimate n=1 Tax=Myriangium duriaei CBS 260.36 TaxID=1168546 RepID=A0A9P4MCR5_9PEZI|nr:shikimate [Myriangium duriaei CBS 260.36]
MSHDLKKLHLVGVGVGHSIAPSMHNYICKSLNKPWKFYATEASTVEKAVELLKESVFAGAVVTMPYKQTIMPYLSGVDEIASKIGACNNVYMTTNGDLRGTNTDWRGVYGCLKEANEIGIGKPAMIIGAGGASRAAVYALGVELKCPTIYVVNRDIDEVTSLVKDTESMLLFSSEQPLSRIVHLQSLEDAQSLPNPYYIVSTVPDFQTSTIEEKIAMRIFAYYLDSDTGVFLDMCFKPRETRKIKLARSRDWPVVEGTEIIGHQISEQYRLWINPGSGEQVLQPELIKEAWDVLRKQAESSAGINFEVDDLIF